MAAAAGGRGFAVSVLAPNGRRVAVRVGPGTTLLQVLEEACGRQNFDAGEFGLKFQRSVLDLSLQWRFAKLPNNAKLEVVPITRNRAGTENRVSSQTTALGSTAWGGGDQPSVDKEVVRDYVEKLDKHKSMVLDVWHPRALKELADVIVEPLAIIFENSWRSGEVPDDWKKANVVPIFKKGKEEDPGNYRPVSLTSVPGKIMEEVLKESILKHLEERKVIRNSQHGFIKGSDCIAVEQWFPVTGHLSLWQDTVGNSQPFYTNQNLPLQRYSVKTLSVGARGVLDSEGQPADSKKEHSLRNPVPSAAQECVEQHGEFSPVCIYMRDEIAGRASLESTTLKSLGLTGGNAIIRVVMKKCGSSGQEEALDTAAPFSKLPVSPVFTEGAVDMPLPHTSMLSKDLDPRDVAFSLNNCTDKQDLIKKSQASLGELWPPSDPAPAPFVPFFGDGQRLGGTPVAADFPVSDVLSSKLPTSLSSPGGPSKPKKSKTSQEQLKEQEQLLEREPVVCHPDLEEPLSAGPQDLPDEFFEVTVDDVRKRLAQLQSERKRLEEAPLMTKSLREAQMKEKLEHYPKVVLRVQFPDRHVLQGFFRPNETG
ncbi:tether containing UBX domain for GLUT4 isoform X4 [Lepidochelys kempii]|uniref:tether containing UBX domain for GLUT4 isoform X4 n=1 Tax=Lepidochelys kempii TaxID=8472 RepID=UPI003C6F6C55